MIKVASRLGVNAVKFRALPESAKLYGQVPKAVANRVKVGLKANLPEQMTQSNSIFLIDNKTHIERNVIKDFKNGTIQVLHTLYRRAGEKLVPISVRDKIVLFNMKGNKFHEKFYTDIKTKDIKGFKGFNFARHDKDSKMRFLDASRIEEMKEILFLKEPVKQGKIIKIG